MKKLPWIIVLALVAGSGWLYSSNRKLTVDVTSLREENHHLQQAQAEMEEAKKNQTQAESDELTRLRKDQEELLRLRNEVRQLRDEKQPLSRQVQMAQAQDAQVQALRQSASQAAVAGAGTESTGDPPWFGIGKLDQALGIDFSQEVQPVSQEVQFARSRLHQSLRYGRYADALMALGEMKADSSLNDDQKKAIDDVKDRIAKP